MRVIPKTFQLGPHTFTVIMQKTVKDSFGDPAYGTMDMGTQSIVLEHTSKDHNRASLIQSMYHELTHAILDVMGSPLSEDEAHVEAFSQLLYQAMKTKRGNAE